MRLVWCLLRPEDELHNLRGTLLPPTAHAASAKQLTLAAAGDDVSIAQYHGGVIAPDVRLGRNVVIPHPELVNLYG